MWFRVVRVTQGHWQCHHLIQHNESTYDFPFNFNRNFASLLYRLWHIASYLSKITDFTYPPAFDAPIGDDPFQFQYNLWLQKPRIPRLSCDVIGIICVTLCAVISIQYRLVTDGPTDGRADRRKHDNSIYRATRARSLKTERSGSVQPGTIIV